jgi:hypothetical protein
LVHILTRCPTFVCAQYTVKLYLTTSEVSDYGSLVSTQSVTVAAIDATASATFTSLHPNYQYTYNIQAFTSVGAGNVSANATATTSESGMLMFIRCRCLHFFVLLRSFDLYREDQNTLKSSYTLLCDVNLCLILVWNRVVYTQPLSPHLMLT